jgi:methylmalonyl-CoA/ethylmalonyl-CoA epimerase
LGNRRRNTAIQKGDFEEAIVTAPVYNEVLFDHYDRYFLLRKWSQAMTTNTTIGITQIGQIALPIQDLDRAVAFYRDTLGLPFLFQAPPGLAFFQCGEVRLLLSRPEGVESAQAAVLYYKVADIQQAYATLQARQVAFIDEPHLIAKLPDHELWMVFFHDSEGNIVALMSEVREN